jgi:phytoene synthase
MVSSTDIVSWTNQDQARAFEITDEIIRSYSRTFFAATALLPHSKRHAVRALYAFCRFTDDLVDRGNATPDDIAAWEKAIDLDPDCGLQTDPAIQLWAHVRELYAIDRRYERELIRGVSMDLEKKVYTTWAELERYCYMVASTVGLLSLPIIGTAPGISFEQASPYAIQLGIALQLTNILRDVGEDSGRGRIYLPEEDLQQFDLSRDDIVHSIWDGRFKNLMRFEIERARNLYRAALPGVALLDRSVRPAVMAAALLYRAILDRIEDIDYQVYTRRAFTTTGQKIAMLPGILFHTILLTPPKGISS